MTKKLILLIGAIALAWSTQAKIVQFTVNMTGQTLSSFGIHVMGDFQNAAGFGADWTPGSCLMVKDLTDTNLYRFTVNIPAFTKYEYKYINGDQSYEVEIVPVESQVGHAFVDNRWIYIDSLNSDTMKLAAVLFGGNAPIGMNMIRSVVDMQDVTVSAAGVHVAGSFQGNDPSKDRMYSFVNKVYEHMSYMTLGSYTYKFYNGNTLANTETVPSTCATAGERSITLTSDIILPTVCFSSCISCYPVSVASIAKLSNFSIYPNPLSQNAILKFNDNDLIHHVALYSATGSIVRTYLNVHTQELSIEKNGLVNGLYLLVIENEKGQRVSQKLSVE